MTLCTVANCGRPATEVICPACVADLVTALRELAFSVNGNGARRPGLLADLQDAVTRQAKLGNTHGKSTSTEPPLPFHIAASELAWEARNTIGTWARDFAEIHTHLLTSWTSETEAAEWMARFPALLAMHPAADEMLDEVTDVAARVRRMVDSAPDRRYLGRCGVVTEGVECTDSLFGAIHRDTVLCHTCGSEHDAHARWSQIQDRVRGYLATASEIAELIAPLFGARVNVNTVRTWALRGRIATRGHNAGAVPLHLVGEVLDTARRDLRNAS